LLRECARSNSRCPCARMSKGKCGSTERQRAKGNKFLSLFLFCDFARKMPFCRSFHTSWTHTKNEPPDRRSQFIGPHCGWRFLFFVALSASPRPVSPFTVTLLSLQPNESTTIHWLGPTVTEGETESVSND